MVEEGTAAKPSASPNLLLWHSVYWQPHRSELEAAGDFEGLAALDDALPRLHDEPFVVLEDRIGDQIIPRQHPVLCAATVLDWLRDRRQARTLLGHLAPALSEDFTTPAGACASWRALAAWVPRFQSWDRHQHVLGFGDAIHEAATMGGIPSPYRTWAIALRAATTRLLELAGEAEDVAVHRLLQDLDDILEGKSVVVTAHVRDVDLVVRLVLTRLAPPSGAVRVPEDEPVEKYDPKDVLAVVDGMDVLWMELCGSPADGLQAYDHLFGHADLYSALFELGARREEFTGRFSGPVQSIADFAVTSGHEAAAFFADRIAAYARLRRRWIPEYRAAEDIARLSGNVAKTVSAQVQLRKAGDDFAKPMERAFKGWSEHRAWVRRSVQREIAEQSPIRDDRSKMNGEFAAAPINDPNRLVTLEEAAALLTVPPKTVWNWINRKNNVLHHVDKLGGPRSVAMRYHFGDIAARRPKGRT